MNDPIPKYVAQQYADGAHGFRAEKRAQLKALDRAYVDLRVGCAFFPEGGLQQMNDIEAALDNLANLLSVPIFGK